MSQTTRSGVQFWEDQIDDQPLPRSADAGVPARHGFIDVGVFDLGSIRAVTHGPRPG